MVAWTLCAGVEEMNTVQICCNSLQQLYANELHQPIRSLRSGPYFDLLLGIGKFVYHDSEEKQAGRTFN
jgi:hypothetical protein